MVFFHFGNDSSSWATGNACYSFRQNLEEDLETQWDKLGSLFSNKAMAGTRILWLSTAPDGSFCLQERNGMITSNRSDLMKAIRQVREASDTGFRPWTVDHVSFSPYGAWFMRVEPSYGEGLVCLSAQGRFPDTFIAIGAAHLDFQKSGPQRSQIQYAFFGAGDAVLVKMADSSLYWDGLGTEVDACLSSLGAGLPSYQMPAVGKNTVLCPYNAGEYFIHLEPRYSFGSSGQDAYRYSMTCDGLTADFLDAVIKGSRPPAHSVPKLPKAPAPSVAAVPGIPAPVNLITLDEDADSDGKADIKEAASGGVPQAARDIYQKMFDEHVQECGRSFYRGFEVAKMMRESGLSDEILCEIWERTDVDRNGQFDREEFVQAMWLITVELSELQDDGTVSQESIWDLKVGGNDNALSAATNFTAPRRANSIPLNQMNTDKKPSLDTTDVSETDKLSKQFGDMKLRESLMSSVISQKPNVKWDDVAGLASAKEELQEAIIFPLRFPHLFQGKRKARRAILLYGPPGTGKSYLAKAVATELEHTFFSISSGDVMSKWYGDSEGLIRQLFELGREKKPSIIFIDEIDALCSNRDGGGGPGGGNEDTARMKTEFLVQMDGVGKDNSGVLVLAATNLPWSLDPAVRRRFQKRIHIPLPDEEARRQLFRIHLGEELGAAIGERDVRELAGRCDGFSGSDVANAIQDGLMVPIKKLHVATHFKKVQHNGFQWYTPCDKSDPSGVAMTWTKVPPNKLKEPALTSEDLLGVLQNVKPSVTEQEIEKYHAWTKQFGLEGA